MCELENWQGKVVDSFTAGHLYIIKFPYQTRAGLLETGHNRILSCSLEAKQLACRETKLRLLNKI
jgi:hypothetical protein